MRLTLRTLLAYLDDTLPPEEARLIGEKVAETEYAQELVEKIRKVTRRRGLSAPSGSGESAVYSDPNLVADYLSDALDSDRVADFESLCLDSDVHLAEVAGCHQILTLLLSAPMRVPPTATQRMYALVKGPESIPDRPPGPAIPVGGVRPDDHLPDDPDADAHLLMGLQASTAESPTARTVRLVTIAGLALVLIAAVWLSWVSADSDRRAPTPRTPASASPASAQPIPASAQPKLPENGPPKEK